MTVEQFEVSTPEETEQLAQKLALLLRPNDVITLTGDLGAGKTTFTKGIGKGLGVKRIINSPTFTIVKTYQGEKPLYHIDAYRLEDQEEDIGFDEYFYGDGITVVEWPSFIASFLPEERLAINITRTEAEQGRVISFEPIGSFFEYVVKELSR